MARRDVDQELPDFTPVGRIGQVEVALTPFGVLRRGVRVELAGHGAVGRGNGIFQGCSIILLAVWAIAEVCSRL